MLTEKNEVIEKAKQYVQGIHAQIDELKKEHDNLSGQLQESRRKETVGSESTIDYS